MRRYIIASHSKFAQGLEEVLNFSTSQGNKINVISAYVSDNNFPEKEVKSLFNEFNKDDEIIIMTDLLSGSVNQKLSNYTDDKTFVITGVNLALALSLLLIPEDVKLTEELIQQNINQAKEQMVLMNTYSSDDTDDE